MAAHASDRGYPSNIPCRRGKQHTMVKKFVGGVVTDVKRILVVFLPHISYGMGVFSSHPNPYSSKAVK
jgi:hypothetical protein